MSILLLPPRNWMEKCYFFCKLLCHFCEAWNIFEIKVMLIRNFCVTGAADVFCILLRCCHQCSSRSLAAVTVAVAVQCPAWPVITLQSWACQAGPLPPLGPALVFLGVMQHSSWKQIATRGQRSETQAEHIVSRKKNQVTTSYGLPAVDKQPQVLRGNGFQWNLKYFIMNYVKLLIM